MNEERKSRIEQAEHAQNEKSRIKSNRRIIAIVLSVAMIVSLFASSGWVMADDPVSGPDILPGVELLVKADDATQQDVKLTADVNLTAGTLNSEVTYDIPLVSGKTIDSVVLKIEGLDDVDLGTEAKGTFTLVDQQPAKLEVTYIN